MSWPLRAPLSPITTARAPQTGSQPTAARLTRLIALLVGLAVLVGDGRAAGEGGDTLSPPANLPPGSGPAMPVLPTGGEAQPKAPCGPRPANCATCRPGALMPRSTPL